METHEIIIAAVIIVAVLILITVYMRKSQAKKIDREILKSFGKLPDREYSIEKFNSIAHYFKKRKEDGFHIDDITWNDLNMDDVFMVLNNTTSSMGEEYLYYLLRTPVTDKEELERREELIQLFSTNANLRFQVCRSLKKSGLLNNISFFEYMERLTDIKDEGNMVHFEQLGLMIASIVSIFFYPVIGIIGTIVMFFVNTITYFKRKSEIEMYYTVLAYMMRSLDTALEICGIQNPVIQKNITGLKETTMSIKAIAKGGALVVNKSNSGDFVEMIVDYVRMSTHIDLIRFNIMLKKLKNRSDDYRIIFEKLGLLDSMIAVASYRKFNSRHSIPELDSEGTHISFTSIYHPLIAKPVTNNFESDKCVLVTGSNASGKSTFIKTVAINSILAQSIHTVTAKTFKSSFFRCMSSMALKDNLSNGESYYIVEIKSLKRICDALNEEVPLLVFVDEVLRGTNTLERIAASSRILKFLSGKNCMSFAATHDIELTYILEKDYAQYHFEEQVTDNDVKFDYKIHDGRAVSRNAIKLLHVMGFEDSIVADAENSVDAYLKTGEWEVL